VNAIVADFERGGLALDPAQRARLQELLDADAACCAAYGSNLGNDSTKLIFKPAELAGCAQSYIADRQNTATGEVEVTLKYPDLLPILANCSVAATRKKMTLARGTKPEENLALVLQGIQYRKEIASLLGYDSWVRRSILLLLLLSLFRSFALSTRGFKVNLRS
jgi:Zn-dependent oligopeptidase